MNEVFGLTADGIRRTAETNRRVLGQLPDTGRRTRRVYVGGSGGPSCTRVRFQVIVSDSLTRTALCAIVSRPYGCGINDIPGTVIDGAAVEICDPAGCFFNDPNDLLQGREGWAEYMMPESGTTFCQDGSYYLVPEWQVYSLCCATDTCNL